jgi:aminoglycoside 6-adenylyltransferase
MIEKIYKQIITWATTEDAIRAIIIEGSRARHDHRIDRFSDYDLNLYVTDVAQFTRSDAWIKRISPVWAMEKESELDGVSSRLVLFEGGYDIDFKLVPIDLLRRFVEQQTLPDDYQRGYKVVLDKDGIASQLPQPGYKAVAKQKPGEEEFLYAVNVFWFELFHLVKSLHRQELWHAKLRDACIKNRLLQMIEWYAQAGHNWDYDTWIVGKYMQSWVEPELWRALFDIFAHFDQEDSWRAVRALMPLYRRLAGETAQHLNYAYPYEMDKAISEFIFEDDDRTAGVTSARDMLLLGLDSGERSLRESLADISGEEYHWEPIPSAEQASDLLLPPDRKRVWRVYQQAGVWMYDYTPEALHPPPFTTIAWIMNHIAQTADMYLYCIKTGKPEGIERRWDDLPIPPNCEAMKRYIFGELSEARAYLVSIPEEDVHRELNKPTPAPWGEMRPTYLNVWGGVAEHAIQHAMQIAARKDRIRYGY